jgi:ATP-dependent DNA helicase RecQ
VLSSHHRDLAQVRALAEQDGIPIRWNAGQNGMPQLHHVREIQSFLQQLSQKKNSLIRASDLIGQATTLLEKEPQNPWLQFLCRIVEAWKVESSDAELPGQIALEFLYETCAESRRDLSYGNGVTLSTVHAAKGTEFDHVLLIGSWSLDSKPSKQEETRRAFYVGMTRARQSLAIYHRADIVSSLAGSLNGSAILHREFADTATAPAMALFNYATLGMTDINLGFAGQFDQGNLIHAALANLKTGATLMMREENGCLNLSDGAGVRIARLSKKAEPQWRPRMAWIRCIRILAMIHRTASQETDQAHRNPWKVPEWELPIVEICYEET